MSDVASGGRKRRLWMLPVVGALMLVGGLIAFVASAIVPFVIEQAVGRVTVVEDADGNTRTVYWRDYPGVAGLAPEEVLDGPRVEEAHAASEALGAELRAAITAEFGLEWAPPASAEEPFDPFHENTQNWFGGTSMLTTINARTSQTTDVPTDWADKERLLELVGDIAAEYGFSRPVLDTDRDWGWTEEDRIRDLGGATSERQVIVSGGMEGPAGQWIFFTFQDLSKDVDGRFAEDLTPSTEHGWQLNTFSFGYGANALLHEGDEAEFQRRLQPFEGLDQPPPTES